jgi:hypothetical protein
MSQQFLFSSKLRQFSASLFLVATFVSGVFTLPIRAYAIPVVVTADIPRDPKELGLDAIAWTVAKILVGTILEELRGFINTGHFGDPLAIIDVRAFFGKLARDTTMAFMGDIGDIDIYQPIKQQILQNLARSYTSYTEEMTSTIQDVLYVPEDFTNDFLKGGWVGFMTILEPRNNIYGQLYMAKDIESRKIAASTGEVQDELSQSGGLLSLPGKCLEYAVTTTFSGNTTTTSQGACIRWERVTPGQFIATTLSKTLGSPVESLNNADEISELLAAAVQVLVSDILMKGINIVTSAANNAVTGALTGSGGSSSSSGSGGSSSGSSQHMASDIDTLIATIDRDIAELSPVSTLRTNLVGADTLATTTITRIDTLLVSVGIDPSTLNTLTSHRAELVTLQTEIRAHIAEIDSAGSVTTYISSIETIKADARQATTFNEILTVYSRYNDIATTVDMSGARVLTAQANDFSVPIRRVNEIASFVNSVTITP